MMKVLKKIRTEYVISVIGLLLSSFIASRYIWNFDGAPLALPLEPKAFTFFYSWLQSRFIFPFSLRYFVTFIFSYLPSLLLIGFYFISLRVFRRKSLPFFWGFIFSCPLILITRPGEDPSGIGIWLIALIGILPSLTSLHPFELWLWTAFLILNSILQSEYQVPLLWFMMAYLLAESLHFFLVERAHLQWKRRQEISKSFLFGLGSTLLAISSLLILWKLLPENPLMHPPKYTWLSLLITLEAAALTWLSPWESRIWLRAVSMAWIVLWTSDALKFAIVLAIGLFGLFIQRINWLSIRLKTKHQLAIGIILCLGLSIWSIQPKSERILSYAFFRSLPEVQEKSQNGIHILGNGFASATPFFRQHLTMSSDIFLIDKEDDLIRWMDVEKIDTIVIEKPYYLDFWRAWMNKDRNSEVSNRSVISRMIAYGGEGIQTATLNLDPIKKLKMEILKTQPSIILISKKK